MDLAGGPRTGRGPPAGSPAGGPWSGASGRGGGQAALRARARWPRMISA